jgi:hypothetical protein
VEIVTTWREPAYAAVIEPEKPPLTEKLILSPAMRPLASPKASNVRSSQVPASASPLPRQETADLDLGAVVPAADYQAEPVTAPGIVR